MASNDPHTPNQPKSDVENWTSTADQWIAWTRTENHDAYGAYEQAFADLIGRGTGTGVELGAGEGRISRTLAGLGWRMTLVEPVAALLSAAEDAGSGVSYIAAKANAVPLDTGGFDLVVLYNVLMDVDDLAGTAAEAARLCGSGGRVIVGIVHPIFDVIQDLETGRSDTPYFLAHRMADTISRDGLDMTFAGWRRPISAYVTALSSAGLAITRMAEPAPDPDHPKTASLNRARRFPLFLWIEARPIGEATSV